MGYFIAIITLDLNTRHTPTLAVYFNAHIIFQKSAIDTHQKRDFLKLPPPLETVFVYMHKSLISVLMLLISELQLLFPEERLTKTSWL